MNWRLESWIGFGALGALRRGWWGMDSFPSFTTGYHGRAGNRGERSRRHSYGLEAVETPEAP